jgi:hypothetical protein
MTTLTLFEGKIADATTSLTLTVRRDLDNSDLPIDLIIDGDELGLTLDVAAKLAKAGERIERTLFKSREAPKESTIIFEYKLGFSDGRIAPFEVGITADPLGVSFAFDKKRLALGLGEIGDLLFALAQIDKAVGHIRGRSEGAFDDARGIPQRPFQPQPAPGERWRTWRPQFHDPDERPRTWDLNRDW